VRYNITSQPLLALSSSALLSQILERASYYLGLTTGSAQSFSQSFSSSPTPSPQHIPNFSQKEKFSLLEFILNVLLGKKNYLVYFYAACAFLLCILFYVILHKRSLVTLNEEQKRNLASNVSRFNSILETKIYINDCELPIIESINFEEKTFQTELLFNRVRINIENRDELERYLSYKASELWNRLADLGLHIGLEKCDDGNYCVFNCINHHTHKYLTQSYLQFFHYVKETYEVITMETIEELKDIKEYFVKINTFQHQIKKSKLLIYKLNFIHESGVAIILGTISGLIIKQV
jgi:hypothetical protein